MRSVRVMIFLAVGSPSPLLISSRLALDHLESTETATRVHLGTIPVMDARSLTTSRASAAVSKAAAVRRGSRSPGKPYSSRRRGEAGQLWEEARVCPRLSLAISGRNARGVRPGAGLPV